jgi:hypothetical protein
MAELAQAPINQDATPEKDESTRIFRARQKPIVAAAATTIAGLLPFVMGMTDQAFFVEAMAWTFLIWGLLLMYYHLIDYTTTYEVTEDGLILRAPFLPWRMKRVWPWQQINKLELVVGRTEARAEDVEMRIYYKKPDSLVIYREDVYYLLPEFAQEIIQRASLKPKKGQAMQTFETVPQDAKETYVWQ